MSQSVLVDTSVWIDYFRGEADAVRHLDRLIDQDLVLVSGLILQEVLQGSRDHRAFVRLRGEMETWPYESELPEDFVRAARLFAELRWKGSTVPPSDCLVAAVALRRGVHLFARDAHFEHVAQVTAGRSRGLHLWSGDGLS